MRDAWPPRVKPPQCAALCVLTALSCVSPASLVSAIAARFCVLKGAFFICTRQPATISDVSLHSDGATLTFSEPERGCDGGWGAGGGGGRGARRAPVTETVGFTAGYVLYSTS